MKKSVESIKKQKKLSAEDGRWLIEIYTTQEARLELALGQADGVRKTIDDRDKKIFQLRETLLLWLAMRGAASVEMFKATQGIANRTVAILNE